MEKALRVVLVDDDPDIRRIMRAVLTSDGIDVVAEAGDGEQALAAVAKHRPHVVLVDLMMPLLNGAQATAHMIEQWPDIVVIGLTAGGRRAKDRMLQAGARAVFDKTQIIELLDWLSEQEPSSLGAAS